VRLNPSLAPIKERIATAGKWSDGALFPKAARKRKKAVRVFIIAREDRRFAVVAANFAAADNTIPHTAEL